MKKVDLLLNQLFRVVNAFKLPVSPKSTALRAKGLLGSINFKIRAAKALIETKVIDLQAPDALPQVKASLRILQEVMNIVTQNLDHTEEITSNNLTNEQVKDLNWCLCHRCYHKTLSNIGQSYSTYI